MKCMFCGTDEVVYVRPYDKAPLCHFHFNEQLERRVKKTISKYKLFGRKDRIGVGISGGKDSIALLHVLKKVEEDFPKSELVAITIDEGIAGYRDEGLYYARKHVEQLDIEHHILSFEHDFGYSLDDLIEQLGERGEQRKYGACSYCGILRRKLLNQAAKEKKVDVVATGHNLEDESETILLNITRGDIMRLARLNPTPRKIHESLVPRAKPFRMVPQAEIVMYCYLNDLEYQEIPCPYAIEAYRGVIRDFMFKAQKEQPMIAFNILAGYDKLLPLLQNVKSKTQLKECHRCGEATAGKFCKACWLKARLDSIK